MLTIIVCVVLFSLSAAVLIGIIGGTLVELLDRTVFREEPKEDK